LEPAPHGRNGVVSDVINYEQVGLTLKFKPLVFPNQDVQVAMEIESKDVAGAQTLTPTFTERTIKALPACKTTRRCFSQASLRASRRMVVRDCRLSA